MRYKCTANVGYLVAYSGLGQTSKEEYLSRASADVNDILGGMTTPGGVTVKVPGAVRDMRKSFSSSAIGLTLAVVLVYLVLMAQFDSFSDPLVILLGVLIFWMLTGTTMNVMSLMGSVMCRIRQHSHC